METPGDGGARRRELRGTIVIAAVMVAILASGVVADRLVAREEATLGPGVTVVFGPAWGESAIGPLGIWSSTRSIGRSAIVISERWEGESPAELLELYQREVLDVRVPDAVLTDPVDTSHSAGEALLQNWTRHDADGTTIRAELLAVVAGSTGVILDARWPEDEDPAIVAEIRRVVASLRIEPLVP